MRDVLCEEHKNLDLRMKIKIQGTQKVIPLACLENTIENYRCVINQHTCTKKRKHAFVNSRGDKIEGGVLGDTQVLSQILFF